MVYFGADFRASGRAVAADMTRAYVPEICDAHDAGVIRVCSTRAE